MTDSLESLSEEEKDRLGAIAAKYSDEWLVASADTAREVIARVLDNVRAGDIEEDIYDVHGWITDAKESEDMIELVLATVHQAARWVRAGELG